jgi:hypothetical protein
MLDLMDRMIAGNYVLVPGTIPEAADAHVPGVVLAMAEAGQLQFTIRSFNGYANNKISFLDIFLVSPKLTRLSVM